MIALGVAGAGLAVGGVDAEPEHAGQVSLVDVFGEVGQGVGPGPGDDVGGGALEEGDVPARPGDGRDEGGRRRTRADDHEVDFRVR